MYCTCWLVLKVKMKPLIGYFSCTYCVNVLTTSLLMIWVAFAEIMMVVTGTLGSQWLQLRSLELGPPTQAPALVPTTAAVQLSFLLAWQAASVWSLLGPGENVTYVWRWGLVQGTRHSHILRHQTRGPGSQAIKQTDIYTFQSSDGAILLIQSVAGWRRGAVRWAGS